MTETYDRTASSSSIFRRVLEAHAPTIEAELASKAIKYTGSGSKSAAKMEFSPSGVTIRLWLDMRFQEGQSDPRENEVRELAELFLGKDFVLSPHRMVEGMWVASLWYKL
jgi:hypothetical protein